MALVAIPTTFLLVIGPTMIIDVSSVVQFLSGLIGLDVAIGLLLLLVTRWRKLRDNGADIDTAVNKR